MKRQNRSSLGLKIPYSNFSHRWTSNPESRPTLYKAVTADLKLIYQSVTEEEALLALDQFSERWDDKYPQISKSWRSHWENLNTLYNYPADIRKVIYTTNAIESLNSVIRKAIKKRKLFPSDDSAKKGDLFSDSKCVKKVDYANQRLETRAESFYD